jgi:hypothetical protein
MVRALRGVLGVCLAVAAAGGCVDPSGGGAARAGAATGGGKAASTPAAGAEGVEGHPRVEFVHYMWSPETDALGKRIPVAQVRVKSASGTAARDYWVRAGDRIGRREAGGDFDTGLTVVKISKGDRPVRTRVADREGWVLISDAYYLLAQEAGGGRYVVWLADGRGLRPDK